MCFLHTLNKWFRLATSSYGCVRKEEISFVQLWWLALWDTSLDVVSLAFLDTSLLNARREGSGIGKFDATIIYGSAPVESWEFAIGSAPTDLLPHPQPHPTHRQPTWASFWNRIGQIAADCDIQTRVRYVQHVINFCSATSEFVSHRKVSMY